MQAFCAPWSVPEPYSVIAGGTTATQVRVEAAVSIPWTLFGTDTYLPTAQAVSAYGGVTVDTTLFVWLLMARQGTTHPWLVKEQDLPTMNSVLGGNWAKLARLTGSLLMPIPQL